MSPQVGPNSGTSVDPDSAAPSDPGAFTAMFENHAAHVFDYCSELLGDEDAAARATETALIAAQGVLEDPERLRAWLFALARECMNQLPESGTWYDGEATDEPPSRAGQGGRGNGHGGHDRRGRNGRPARQDDPAEARTEVLSAADIADYAERVAHAEGAGHAEPEFELAGDLADDLAGREQEIFDLVYRHGIRPDHLPVVLGVSPDRARAIFTAAVAAHAEAASASAAAGAQADQDGAGDIAGLEEKTAKPLAAVPPSVRHRTFQAVFGTDPPHARDDHARPPPPPDAAEDTGQPESFDRARKRLRIAAIAALPAAAAVGAILYFAGSPDAHSTADARRTTSTHNLSGMLTTGTADPGTSPSGHKQLFRSPTHAVLPVVDPAPGTGYPTPGPTHTTSKAHPSPTKIRTLSPSPSSAVPTTSPAPTSPAPTSPAPTSPPSSSASSTTAAATPSATPSASQSTGSSSLTAVLPVPGPSSPAVAVRLVLG